MIKSNIYSINFYNPDSGTMSSEELIFRATPYNLMSLRNVVEITLNTAKIAVELDELEAVVKDLKEEFKNG